MYNHNPFVTFQGLYQPNFSVPPPASRPMTDQEYVKSFEGQTRASKSKALYQDVTNHLLMDIIKESDMLSREMESLQEKIETISDSEWLSKVNAIKERKSLINHKIADLRGPYMDNLRKGVGKINAKKARRKRVRAECKREKEAQVKQWEERSRKIDENLQKIKEEDDNKKQQDESKAQADIILKEVLRRKSDAKKSIAKLDALVKLRRARQNTARGGGKDVSERDAESFNGNIDKLRSLWLQKLSLYENEESILRSKLKKDVQSTLIDDTQKKTVDNLGKWKTWLFGDAEPQRDFGGDVGRFVNVRSQWDHYVSREGTALPVGWVVL